MLRNLVVYKSSAGSGKTTTLVRDYLRITIPKPNLFKAVVGLTFTIKATAEMKNRVIEVLEKISENDFVEHDFIHSLLVEIANDNSKDLEWAISNSRILLSNILHNYSYFTFSTIDSFVLNVVRSFAFDLKLPTKFKIELDEETLINMALSRLFNRVGEDEVLTDFMLDFIMGQLDDEKDLDIESSIGKLAKMIFNQSNFGYINEIKDNTLTQISNFKYDLLIEKDSIEKELIQFGKLGFEIVNSSSVPFDVFPYSNVGGLQSFFKKLVNVSEIENIFGKRVIETFEEEKFWKKNASASVVAQVELIKPQLIELYWKIKDYLAVKGARYASIKILLSNLSPFALLNQVNKHVQEIYSEEGMIHLSESTRRVSEIVSKEPMPFIFERIGNVYQNYFIDEFQDTSTVQWGNLIPLVENSLASGYRNLIVGDAKQSIYRWNGGEVSQFVNLPDITNAVVGKSTSRQKIFKDNYQFHNLDSNYRSSTNIIRFNNSFFGFYKNQFSPYLQSIYQDHEQIERREINGGVSIVFNDIDEENQSCQAVYNRVVELLARGFELGQIVVVARKNKDISRLASHLLSVDGNLRIVSNESLLLKSSHRVGLVVNTLFFLLDPSVEIYKFSLISSLYKNLSFSRSVGEIWHDFKNVESLQSINLFLEAEGVPKRFQEIESNTVYGIATSVINSFGLNTGGDPFINSLIDVILGFQDKNSSALLDFLEFWELRKEKLFINLPDVGNSLKLMTIHKSKGLQFPVVVYYAVESRALIEKTWVDVSRLFNTPLKKIVVNHTSLMANSYYATEFNELRDKQEADSVNAHYVALTRPKDELHIIISRKGVFSTTLKTFLDQGILPFEKHEDNIFSLGDFGVRVSEASAKTAEPLDESKLFGWAGRVKLKLVGGNMLPAGQENKRNDGIYLHSILSMVEDYNSLDSVLKNIAIDINITYEKKAFYSGQVKKIVNHEKAISFFKPGGKVKLEKSLSTLSGVYRPDRVVWQEGVITVIDFKFVNLNEVMPKMIEHYREQVKGYSESINKIENMPTVGVLIFVGDEVEMVWG